MTKDILLRVDSVGKKFSASLKRSMWYGLTDVAASVVGKRPKPGLRRSEFWALKDVSFELERGQVLGVVGPNGSGKTTLMRVIAGIYPSDEGTVTRHGRVTVVFANGPGMHPHYTGRENIYLIAAMYGLSKKQIDSRMGEIILFAGIGTAIDRPLGTYSSGMRSRLAYAVAFTCDPDLFISDEGIAVGDLAFKEKCYAHIRSLAKDKSVIFVSSSVSKIKRLATRVLILVDGRQALLSDNIEEALSFYKEQVLKYELVPRDSRGQKGPRKQGKLQPPHQSDNGKPEMISIHIPKTAGTTFRDTLEQVYGSGLARLDISRKGRVRLNRELLTDFRTISRFTAVHGHFVYSDLVSHFSPPAQARVVTWVRHPVERVCSAYFYYRRMLDEKRTPPQFDQELMQDGTLLGFARHPLARNQMAYYLDGLDLQDFFFIGLQEHFSEDLKHLAKLAGWAHTPAEAYYNETGHDTAVETTVLDTIAELNQQDMDVYHRALQMRKDRLAQFDGS